jgi:hypothetical protein
MALALLFDARGPTVEKPQSNREGAVSTIEVDQINEHSGHN